MKPLKVLMLGWEFPPHNSGGLGTACESLAKALARKDNVEVTFVLPKRVPLDSSQMKFVFADDMPGVKFRPIDSPLMPYMTADEYLMKGLNEAYAGTLFEEVKRYAELARLIAQKEDFDVIHAHEWLTLGAAAEIKKVSGKPFVAHIHSNEYHRSAGGYGHPLVHKLEEQGMKAADKVVAISRHVRDVQTTPWCRDALTRGKCGGNRCPSSSSFPSLEYILMMME